MDLSAEKTRIIGSFAPASMAEAREAAAFAKDLADVEVRLDALGEPVDFGALRACFEGKTLVAALRSAAEGGGFSGGDPEARSILSKALAAGFDLADVEYRAGENAGLLGLPPEKVILSLHDLEGLPPDVTGLAERMAATGARYVKIVGTANDSSDAVRLLEAQKTVEGSNLSLFGMGEAGIATRVLAPYLGAPLMFASFVPGRATAPGQLQARDLLDVYGVGRARRASRLVALFGSRVSHSFSPALQNANFEALGEASLYVPFALRSLVNELPALRDGLARLGLPLQAASVTIPFKEEAGAIAGATEPANTLLFDEEGAVSGANTDAMALRALIPSASKGERALVLGAGGTARTAVGILRMKGYKVSISNRDRERGEVLARATGSSYLSENAPVGALRVLLNATPLGLLAEDPLPCEASVLIPGLLVVDAPYREGGTTLARAARAAGCDVVDGFAILLAQAAGQASLFTGRPVSPGDLVSRLPGRTKSFFAIARPASSGATR
ncbi:MAG: type I 3-dehydroquinate dehydratase [Thermoanaerobaculia bacterium]